MKSAAETNLLAAIDSAREVCEQFECLSDDWEKAMDVVRGLVDLHINLYPIGWSDEQWEEMQSR